MDVCIRRQLSHSTALLGIALVGQRILFQIVRRFIPVSVSRPDSINIGVAVCVGVSAVNLRLFHRYFCHNTVRQSVIIRLGFDHFVQNRRCAPADEDVSVACGFIGEGKGMGSCLAASSRCRFIMTQALAGNRTVGGELRRCACHMMMGTENVFTNIVIAVVTDMDGIIVVIRIVVAVAVHRVDGIKRNILGGHDVLIMRDDLVDVRLRRVFRKRVRDLLFTPTDEDRLFALFQISRAGIIRADLLALDMRGGRRSRCPAASVEVIGEGIELFYFRCKGYIAGNCYFPELIGGIWVGSVRPVSGEAIAFIGGDCWDHVPQFVPVPHLGCSSALPIWHAERHLMGLLQANHQILCRSVVILLLIHIQNNAGRGGVLSHIQREFSSAFRQGEFQRIFAVGVGAAGVCDSHMVGVRPAACEFKISI